MKSITHAVCLYCNEDEPGSYFCHKSTSKHPLQLPCFLPKECPVLEAAEPRRQDDENFDLSSINDVWVKMAENGEFDPIISYAIECLDLAFSGEKHDSSWIRAVKVSNKQRVTNYQHGISALKLMLNVVRTIKK